MTALVHEAEQYAIPKLCYNNNRCEVDLPYESVDSVL